MRSKNISEIVTYEKIRKWSKGDIITITAGTGMGKSYFIKNKLYAFAEKNKKRILMLIHRTNCVDQFNNEIITAKKADIIDIKTYQYLESLYKNNRKFDFSKYEYIVCDEFHYFMSDARFNKTTDISLEVLLNQMDVVKIFMSATSDAMKTYIRERKGMTTIDYEIPISYNFIQKLKFFMKDETMEKFMEEAIERAKEGKQDNKGIFFIQSAEKAYNLYKKYEKNCLFCCGKSDKHYKYVNSDKIKNMLKSERFEEQFLITTTCLDAGVNIKDENVKHIVIDNKDLYSLIQCMGRKRLENDRDKIYVYIKAINNKQIGGMETQIKNKIKMADFLMEHTVKEFIEKFPREYDHSNIVYTDTVDEEDKGTFKVNDLMYVKCNRDLCDIEFMKMRGRFGYCKYLAHEFGFQDEETGEYHYSVEDEEYDDKLEVYLNSIIGLKLYKKEQNELAIISNIKRNGKLMKSLNSINSCFDEEGIKYHIIDYTDWKRTLENGIKNIYYGKKYWVVNSLNNVCQEKG
ncbi:hypothetical protein SAMN02745134_00821 [Clostridium acidisoli DSM 12555]|uniref:Helicase/UvrB N-terminal domain-containing protein n=1 Tax=Clostridium acidisoli DSM 12555 TaxID=1121291 RepID=A0A1W1X649_9CLOT|nr:DEAD/DEAH box helicase family protein [Clostridium acidisoli]SMC19405.1 hypothetical protein SAMN02745134_00821 [Clostridium acidisoli DSM 12555]